MIMENESSTPRKPLLTRGKKTSTDKIDLQRAEKMLSDIRRNRIANMTRINEI